MTTLLGSVRLRRPRLISAVLCALTLAALGARPVAADTPVPPTDFASPYVAAFDGQLPSGDPWAPPRNSGEDATRTSFRKEYQSGVRWSYTWVPWTSIEKQRGVRDFHDLDNYVSWARAEGILLRVQLMTGDWSLPQTFVGGQRENAAHPGPNVPGVDLTPAVDWWAAMVRRYMPGGDLAKEKGWHDGYGVSRWEMENEPGCLAWWGTWGRVPKDYAQFAQLVHDRVKKIDPRIEIAGPAMAQQENSPDDLCPMRGIDGSYWLNEAFNAKQSDWQSTTYTASATHPALGPYIDAISWHFDNVNLSDGSVPARAKLMRDIVTKYSTQKTYPSRADTPSWYSEGDALGYNSDDAKFATAQVQLMALLHGADVATMNLGPGTQINSDTWTTTPMYGAQRALITYLPRAGQTVPANGDVDPARVVTFRRTDPATGARTWVLWAKNAAAVGANFTVRVPARASTVDVVRSDTWKPSRVNASGGVPITLHADDPSPVVIVAERTTTATRPAAVPTTGGGTAAPAGTLPTTGAPLGPAVLGLVLLVAVGLTRRLRSS